MNRIFADLHIHLGRTESNLPVKITAARNMTFHHVVQEASGNKGLSMIGIIDAHSPPVQEEIQAGITQGIYQEHPNGGIIYQNTVCLLGVEVECREPNTGPFHMLAYFPTLEAIKQFTAWLQLHMKNVQLSTQRLYQPVLAFMKKVKSLQGLVVPAHIFTPFKSLYGSATTSIRNLLDISLLDAVELGLSADTYMADQISELATLPFLTNSDAHSLPKIGREYNEFLVEEPSFQEFTHVLKQKRDRKIVANYGLNPRLGKYYQTFCLVCELQKEKAKQTCPACGSIKEVTGVKDRIAMIKDQPSTSPNNRPSYIHQIPLDFIPKVGNKTISKLISHFGSEMNILHHAPIEEIAKVTNETLANYIDRARKNNLIVEKGGGGTYGKVISSPVTRRLSCQEYH
ncbi:endonuclease Q family protein [Shimazuella sp. AN120528]|uniref:endonuclease Q family protein n=1 Tax=Shimazuella soli TaxID=1892854 RepID=UPI001F0DBCE8|nr:endonuclease Q family protein [Shimazuella soli]MCH5584199.1 endonuclease Q family protein [Shimazuella soli]